MSEYIVEWFGIGSRITELMGSEIPCLAVKHLREERRREEIVRCKSCKYYDQNDAPSEVYPDRYWCDRMTSYMPTDGFCSFGKRKVVGE